jgi:hypothetical protein
LTATFFETRADAARLLEPADALLNDVPPAIGLLAKLDVGIVPGMFVVLVRDAGRDFFVSAGSGAGGSDAGSVDAPKIPVDQTLLVQLHLLRLDDDGKHAGLAPLAKVVVHRLPGTKAFGQISPQPCWKQNSKTRSSAHPADNICLQVD